MLPPSCDTGFALVGLDLGAPLLSQTAQAFGFNKAPPLDLPGVQPANFPPASSFKYNLPGLAYSAIGQENVQETALQNALVAATIANGGVQMTPHLLSYVAAPDGTVVYRYRPHAYLTAITPSQDAQIVPLMQKVVSQGTAYGLFPSWLDAAAKTGTAQIGNAAHQLDDWLIAFAPASNPTIAVAVVMPYQPVDDRGRDRRRADRRRASRSAPTPSSTASAPRGRRRRARAEARRGRPRRLGALMEPVTEPRDLLSTATR